MEVQIKELLSKGVIRPSKSPHHIHAFIERNHAEQVRGKARMIIDYRDVNAKTVVDGYKILRLESLSTGLEEQKYFQNLMPNLVSGKLKCIQILYH